MKRLSRVSSCPPTRRVQTTHRRWSCQNLRILPIYKRIKFIIVIIPHILSFVKRFDTIYCVFLLLLYFGTKLLFLLCKNFTKCRFLYKTRHFSASKMRQFSQGRGSSQMILDTSSLVQSVNILRTPSFEESQRKIFSFALESIVLRSEVSRSETSLISPSSDIP